MPPIKFTDVLSYSSQDPNHPASNLLRPDTFRKWKCAPNNSEKQSFVILKFEELASINSLDIGNDGSALIEVLVSREGMSDYQLLLVSSAFMSPSESRNGTEMSRVRMFGLDRLNKNIAVQKWDRMKVICTQPFNPKMQFGLSFITARSLESEARESPPKVTQLGKFTLRMEDDSDTISVGSMFAKRNEKAKNLTGPAAIRAASRESAAASPPASDLKRKDPSFDSNLAQVKKKQATESPKLSMAESSSPASSSSHPSKEKKKERHIKDNSMLEGAERKSKPKIGEKTEESKKKPNENKYKEKGNKPSTSKSDSQETSKKRSKPFTSLMDNVVFVMSGYQNPERSNLRDKLVEMGAQYKSDWSPGCTHLICAFKNTPKYKQVKGKGKIVTGEWIKSCYKNKKRFPWRRYGLDKSKDGVESEEEIWAEELLPKVSKPDLKTTVPADSSDTNEDQDYSDEDTDDEIQKVLNRQQDDNPHGDSIKAANSRQECQETKQDSRNKHNDPVQSTERVSCPRNEKESVPSNGLTEDTDEDIYEDDTDVDEEAPDTSSLPLPVLEDYFKGKHFLLYGNMKEENRKLLSRYITAYSGEVENYMSDKVQFIITEDKWDDNFEEALSDNSALQFVKPQWIWRCCDKKQLVPHQPYLIVP